MAEEFEDKDFSEASFWGVDLTKSTWRDVNFTGARMKSVWVVDVDIDGLLDRLVVNGVDVTSYVNANDPWYPLRGMLRPTDIAGLRSTLDALDEAWAKAVDRVRALPEASRDESVGGEWSFVETQRHLVFGVDKWFSGPLLGRNRFHAFGLPNTGSRDFGWLGLDLESRPKLDEVLAVRAGQGEQLREFLDNLTVDDFTRDVEVLENGSVPLIEGYYVVFEESFEHLRYAVRDLAQLESR